MFYRISCFNANSLGPDQTPRSVTSDQGLHCLPITLLGVSRLKWVKLDSRYFCWPFQDGSLLQFFFVLSWLLHLWRFVLSLFLIYHYETCLFKYTENFTTKNERFQIKNSDIFHISAQNIDCGYVLEPPRRGGSNAYPLSMFLSRNKKKMMYTPLNPSFII